MIPDYIYWISVASLCIVVSALLVVDIIIVRKVDKKLKIIYEQYKVLESLGIIEKYGLNEEQIKEIFKEKNNE